LKSNICFGVQCTEYNYLGIKLHPNHLKLHFSGLDAMNPEPLSVIQPVLGVEPDPVHFRAATPARGATPVRGPTPARRTTPARAPTLSRGNIPGRAESPEPVSLYLRTLECRQVSSRSP
jgi:hypothetical protein